MKPDAMILRLRSGQDDEGSLTINVGMLTEASACDTTDDAMKCRCLNIKN